MCFVQMYFTEAGNSTFMCDRKKLQMINLKIENDENFLFKERKSSKNCERRQACVTIFGCKIVIDIFIFSKLYFYS